jgi:hypothetical protein
VPVQVQNLFVPVGGLETEIDDKLLPAGKMLDLENAYMPRLGEAVKRFGTTALAAPSALPYTLATHKGALVAFPYADPLEVLPTPTAASWVKGTASGGPIQGGLASRISTIQLTKVAATSLGTASTNIGSDVDTNGTHYFTAYLDGGNNRVLHFVAIEVNTGHVVADSQTTLAATDFYAFKVKYCNGFAVCAYARSDGTVVFLTMNASTFAVSSTSLGVVSLVGGGLNGTAFDLAVKNSTTVMCLYPFNTGTVVVRCTDFVPSTLTATNFSPKDSAAADIGCNNAAAWMQDISLSGKIAIMASKTGPDVRVHWDIPTAGATRQAVSSYTFTPAGEIARLTGHTTGSSATGEFVVVCGFFSGVVTGSTTDYVSLCSRLSGVLTSGPILYRGASLRSKTWQLQGVGDFFAIVSFSSSTQGTHYVVKIPTVSTAQTTAAPLAITAVRGGMGGGMTSVCNPATNVYTAALSQVVRFDSGPNPDALGIQLATVRYGFPSDTSIGPPKEVIDSLFAPGSMMRHFDGVTFSEAGFAYDPEQPGLTPGAAGAGLVENSDYYYALVYSRVDAQGRLWRSGDSIPMLVHTGAGQRQVTVACPTLRLTGMTNVKIEVYRGARGIITDLRKVGIVANDITADTVNFVDTVTDTTQASCEPLYTSGGVIANDTPPGFIALTVAQNRLWGISADDPQAVWYTKEFVIGHGLEWSEDQVIDVRDERGSMRGLAVIDNKPIAWKDDAMYVCLGTGPNVLNEGGTYVFETSQRGFGSNNPMALCETKDGAMFVSTSQRAGIFLLDRSLTAQYVGAAVQRYVADPVTAGIYISKLNQVRFYGARTMVYDLVNAQWSIFTGQVSNVAVAWNGVPVYISVANNHILYEKMDGSIYTDDGNTITAKYGFPWIQINQAKGYQRFRGLQLLGTRAASLSNATLSLYRELDDSAPFLAKAIPEFRFTNDVLDDMLRYSSKVSALKVLIQDGSTTAGLKVNGFTVIIGPKQGLRKQAPRIT